MPQIMTFLVVIHKLQLVLNFIHYRFFLNKIGTMNKSYLLLRLTHKFMRHITVFSRSYFVQYLQFIFRYEINVLKTIR